MSCITITYLVIDGLEWLHDVGEVVPTLDFPDRNQVPTGNPNVRKLSLTSKLYRVEITELAGCQM